MRYLMIAMTILLSGCWNSKSTNDFCLLYTKPTITSLEVAAYIVDNDKQFADAVNVNKGLYKRLCK